MDDKNLILELRQQLHQHGINYYCHNAPTISDHEYDQLFCKLQDLEAKHPELADPCSPTARVGAKTLNKFSKVKHEVPMLSLDNTFTAFDAVHRIVSEVGPCYVVLEPKVDGLAVGIKYDESGHLVQAVTRGDHETGDDVTANVKTIAGVPLVIKTDRPIEVRGEVYLAKDKFAKLNKELEDAGEELFANARNAAAGSLKQKDSKECAKRGLSFVAYYVVNPLLCRVATQHCLLEWLKKLGFPIAFSSIADFKVVHLSEFSELSLAQDLAEFDITRKSLPYDTDGCVLKVNDLRLQERLGNKTRSPKWACAYKYPAEKALTQVLSITCQVGRTGRITPVAELKPVSIEGATVKRATLNNQDYIDSLGLDIGDTVEVERAGCVIPRVIRVAEKV